MLIDTITTGLRKGQSTNSTATSFAVADSRPTTTKPAASATRTILDFSDLGLKDRNTLCVIPYGGDANNDQFAVKVYGWNVFVPKAQTGIELWIPRFICGVDCTISSSLPGIAGSEVVATEFFCDTIAASTAAGISVIRQGTADVDVAWFECDISPFQLVELRYDMLTGGDRANALLGH